MMFIKKYLKVTILIAGLLGTSLSFADPSFSPRSNYCDNHSSVCANLPASLPPQTVIIIHGMNASLDMKSQGVRNGTYTRMSNFLNDLGNPTHDPNSKFKVYAVDYNSNGYHGDNQPILLEVQSDTQGTCNNTDGWQNCWTPIESTQDAKAGQPGRQVFSQTTFHPKDITIRGTSEAIRKLLINASIDGYIPKAGKDAQGNLTSNPVTIIAHSMGGLVARDMLYHDDDSNITGYEDLLNNGIWINEYISFGTPHVHGFFGVYNQQLAAAVQGTDCAGYIHSSILQGLAPLVVDQFCMFEQWTQKTTEYSNAIEASSAPKWQDGKDLHISKYDFPQIHWVYVSGLGQRMIADAVDGDYIVSYHSSQDEPLQVNSSGQETGVNEDNLPDNQVYLDAFQAHGNGDQALDLNGDGNPSDQSALNTVIPYLSGTTTPNLIPGQYGDSNDNPATTQMSPGTNAIHDSIINVAYYAPGSGSPVQGKSLASCSTDGSGQGEAISSCFGYFQYTIPSTLLSQLPGYTASSEYFTRNPQFFPGTDASKYQGVTNPTFADTDIVKGVKPLPTEQK